jgi:hypothetical protein
MIDANRQAVAEASRIGRPRKLTPERLQQIINLVDRQKSPAEIAELVGVPVGLLSVTCSRLGISLRRSPINNGVRLGRPFCRDEPVPETPEPEIAREVGTPTMQPDPISSQGRVSPTEEDKPAAALDEASRGRFAFTVQYKGQRRTTELPLSQKMIGKIALEAQFRDMQMGQLLGELITATMNKDLFQIVLGEEVDALSKLQVKKMQIFPS